MTVSDETTRSDEAVESSAIEAWANERDLAEALGSFGDGYRRAQLDAQRALGLDRLSAEERAERETGSVLTQTELRELYFKALQRGYAGLGAGVGHLTLHKLVDEVLATRDRELQRLRQRLRLATDGFGPTSRDEEPQRVFDEAEEVRVRREERLKVLDEVAQVLREENQTPYDTIALSGPMARLRKMRRDAERGLDNPSRD